VAGPVIQATGRSEFEDGLGSGDFVSGYSYHMSVRTRFSDHTKQTKLQSQRPNDVETPVPSISSTEVQQHQDSQFLPASQDAGNRIAFPSSFILLFLKNFIT
jgi:hypothetical protein